MAALGILLEEQRSNLNGSRRFFLFLMLSATLLAAVSFALFVLSVLTGSTFELADRFLADDPGRALDAASLLATFAFGSAIKVWRVRQERLKLLIAQAFVLEGDHDSAVRLLLGRIFGGDAATITSGQMLRN